MSPTIPAPAARPQALSRMPAGDVDGLLTDIDDTLTRDGRLAASTFHALERLHRAGIRIVPVTGRSAGWAHMILKTWPVDAVVAESGGLYLARDPANGRLREVMHDDPAAVARDRAGVLAIAEEILASNVGFAPASDHPYRRVDVAIDWCEEIDPVPPAALAAAIARFHRAGYQARASSVHVNAWSGSFDKAPMALRCLREVWSIDEDQARARWVFIGDAPNDASMYEALPRSVGVANIGPMLDRLPVPPAYLTPASHGAGFEQLAEHLLRGRGG